MPAVIFLDVGDFDFAVGLLHFGSRGAVTYSIEYYLRAMSSCKFHLTRFPVSWPNGGMDLDRKAFQMWGAMGGRARARRLTKARLRQIAKNAGSAPKRRRPRKDPSQLKPRYIKTGKPPGVKSKVNIEQAEAMYRKGDTLEVIGFRFGVTRERVRQIFRKRGITQMDGGGAIRTFLNTQQRAQNKKRARNDTEKRIRKHWEFRLKITLR